MVRSLRLVTSIAALSLLSASACTVYSTPGPATEAEVVEAPPPPADPPPEPAPPPPSTEHVWVPSYQRWNGHAYAVERGHYERRPHPGSRYVRGHWERRGRHQVWVDSHWE